MSYGPVSVFYDTIASGTSTSIGVDLKKSWNKISVQVGTMSTSASLSIQNSVDDGASFYPVYEPFVNTATVGVYPVSIGSAVGTSGGIVTIHAPLKYPRIVASGVVSGGVLFRVLCAD